MVNRRYFGENLKALRGHAATGSVTAIRTIELRRLVKPAGSLCLRCALTASHYLKFVEA